MLRAKVAASRPKFARCFSPAASEVARTIPYLEYARSARQDVAEIMQQLEGSPAERLHGLSSMALEIWPKESPHWRLAGEVLPQEIEARALQEELSGEAAENSGESRATMLRVLCGIRSRPSSRLAESVVKGGLVWKIPLQELCQCLTALADSSWHPMSKDSALVTFASEGIQRVNAGVKLLALDQLLSVHRAASKLQMQSHTITLELRKRVLRVLEKSEEGVTSVSTLVAAAQTLNETAALRSPLLREALLPGVLSVDDATEVLRALPESGFTSEHEFIVSLAVRQIVSARQLTTRQIGAALNAARALQASAQPFALKEVAKLLQSLWPRVPRHLKYLSPNELADAMCAYWWQLLYSNQDGATPEIAVAQPLPSLRGEKAVQELSSKLLRPVLAQLHEFPLRQVGACLTALAPPVQPPDMMSEKDRKLLRDAVSKVFTGSTDLSKEDDVFVEPWMQDFWSAELRALSDVEALELTCGLREAGMTSSFPMNVVMADVNRRLKKMNQEVELSHFLLLRMCRVMDLWHRHDVEAVLQKLLSNPEALRPLPTAYFVALLSAITTFPVPKDLPLRLTASFLDRAESGHATAMPDQWAEILCAVRPLDEPFFERITPRLLQQLLPHLQGLSHERLLKVLDSLAKAPPKESPGTSFASSPVEQAPLAFNEVVAEVVKSGKWDLQKVMAAFSCLGRLGWYNEEALVEVLRFVMDAPFLEPHAPLLLPLVQACSNLHVHHAPLLQKVVNWYCWCCAYLWNKPLSPEKLDELLELAEECLELSFQSLELQGVLAENLSNPKASSRQSLRLLSVLARSSHFPPEFKATCAQICSQTADLDLMSLTTEELVNAFNIHLCGVFDGPAALKRWLTEDSSMKLFFQVHTSQKWYQKQDYYRSMFRQSDAYTTLRQAAESHGMDLRNSDPGEVYHLELISRDAKDRLATLSEKPPIALICISSKEQLRWYVPVTAGSSQELALQNRCRQFNYMFRGSVQKVRHAQTMGYRPCIIWMSDWKGLQTEEEQVEYLRKAAVDCDFFKPAAVQDDSIYD